MSTAGLFILLAIGAGVVAFVAWPLIFSAAPRDTLTPLDSKAEREAILESLRSLDFDYQTGKVIEEDYRVTRAALVAQGADVLRRLDEDQPHIVQKRKNGPGRE